MAILLLQLTKRAATNSDRCLVQVWCTGSYICFWGQVPKIAPGPKLGLRLHHCMWFCLFVYLCSKSSETGDESLETDQLLQFCTLNQSGCFCRVDLSTVCQVTARGFVSFEWLLACHPSHLVTLIGVEWSICHITSCHVIYMILTCTMGINYQENLHISAVLQRIAWLAKVQSPCCGDIFMKFGECQMWVSEMLEVWRRRPMFLSERRVGENIVHIGGGGGFGPLWTKSIYIYRVSHKKQWLVILGV